MGLAVNSALSHGLPGMVSNARRSGLPGFRLQTQPVLKPECFRGVGPALRTPWVAQRWPRKWLIPWPLLTPGALPANSVTRVSANIGPLEPLIHGGNGPYPIYISNRDHLHHGEQGELLIYG